MDATVPSVRTSVPLQLKGAHNVRDLGGYPFTRDDGTTGTTASGAFLRSGTLGWLRASDRAFLRAYGLRRVVDVRSNFELKYWPDPYGKHPQPGVSYTHIPMLDQLNSSGFRGALPACMFDVYRSLLDDSSASLRQVFEALDGEGCSLFHCRAGKDRTGVIAMLLLGLAGVSDDDIVADYAATQRYLGHGLRAQRVAVSIALRRRAPRCLFEAVPSEMELTIVHLHERYGTARAYLEGHAGISSQVLDRLAGRLRGM